MDVSIITVTWNSAEHIADQIRSVIKAGAGIIYEQIIVDNASSDGTVDIIKRHFPEVTLIENQTNAGFAAANNLAARLTSGRILLFLNPDMVIEVSALKELLWFFDNHPKAGVVGGALFGSDQKLLPAALPRKQPGLIDQLAIILKIAHLFQGLLKHYLYSGRTWDKDQQVDSVRGSLLGLSRALYSEFGQAFDPRYFIWFEEVDLCREALRRGYEVWFTPAVRAFDRYGQSFRQANRLWKQRQFTKSMYLYFKKWEPWYVWMWILLARPIGITIVWLFSMLKRIR